MTRWFDTGFDLSYRPDTYWPQLPSEQSVVNAIHGTMRRRAVEAALQAGEGIPEEIVDIVLDPELDDSERQAFSAVHPLMMGGEYLPPDLEGEVEIARVSLQSTTGDVISLRARPADGKIAYRLVDEYEDETGGSYRLKSAESDEPLTMRELIDLIDSAEGAPEAGGAFAGFLYYDVDLDEALAFVSISSPFYPRLGEYYGQVAIAWARHTVDDLDGEERAEHEAMLHRLGGLAVTRHGDVIEGWPATDPLLTVDGLAEGDAITEVVVVRELRAPTWQLCAGGVWTPPIAIGIAPGMVPRRKTAVLRVAWEEPTEPSAASPWTASDLDCWQYAPSELTFWVARVGEWQLLAATDDRNQTLLLAAARATEGDLTNEMLRETLRTNGEHLGIQLFSRAPSRISGILEPDELVDLLEAAIAPDAVFWPTAEGVLGVTEDDWDGWPTDPPDEHPARPEAHIPEEEIQAKRAELEQAVPPTRGAMNSYARARKLGTALEQWIREQDPSFQSRLDAWAKQNRAREQLRERAREERRSEYRRWLLGQVMAVAWQPLES